MIIYIRMYYIAELTSSRRIIVIGIGVYVRCACASVCNLMTSIDDLNGEFHIWF